jgi:peptide/nickel transport system substrate-binding protein
MLAARGPGGAQMLRWVFVLVVAATALACAPAAPQAGGGGPAPIAQSAPRTITMGVRYELISGQSKALNNSSSDIQKRLFNASLALMDAQGQIRPYLAETLPQLNTGNWKVNADGTMETTYQLRPNLTWQDGQALGADDFVFAYGVYSSKAGLAIFTPTPQDRMSEVLAPDPRTVVIRWKAPFPDAGSLRFDHFDPLPRHILGPVADLEDADALSLLPFWTREYISSGPYKMDRWEPGALVEAVAFGGHALGRPRIDRIIVRFIPDENTMLTNVLSESVDVALDNGLRFEHALVLKEEWGPGNKGTVLLEPMQARTMSFQRRLDVVSPRALLDLRVRKALTHGIDKQGLVDGLYEGQIPPSETIMPPNMPYFAELDRAIVKYSYDPRRTEELFAEAGFRRGADGILIGGESGERMSFQFLSGAGTRNIRERSVISDAWRRMGIEVSESQFPPSGTTDPQVRALAPGVLSWGTTGGESSLARYPTNQIGTAANRWRGQNYMAWSNADFDRLYEQFNSTLDRSERDRQVLQMLRLVSEDLGTVVLYHDQSVTAFRAPITGPQVGVPDHTLAWNVHEWTAG